MRGTSRLLSPAGFVLVGLLFLFPFIAVSCDDGSGTFDATYSGVDLATGNGPAVTLTGDLSTDSGSAFSDAPGAGVTALAVITLVLVLAGVVVGLLPVARRAPGPLLGPLLTSLVATAAGAMLITTEVVAREHIGALITVRAGAMATEMGVPLTASYVDSVVHTRFGYWIAVLLLGALAVGNAVALLLGRRRAET